MMAPRTLRPLSPEIETLLAHERAVPPYPEIVGARLITRAQQSLRALEAETNTPRRVAAPFRRLLFAAATCLVLAAGAAAAYQMIWRPQPLSKTSTTRRSSLAQPLAAQAPDRSGVLTPATAIEPAASSKIPGAGPRAATPQELQILVRARKADARGDHLEVLDLLAQHKRSYPAGRLAEEREVLRVKALVALGRRSKARQVAASFREQFPRSVFLPKIDQMLTSSR